MHAAYKGQSGCMRLLIESKASLNVQDPLRKTALMLAAKYKHKDACELLLNAGCNAFVVQAQGQSAADMAAASGAVDIAQLIKSCQV